MNAASESPGNVAHRFRNHSMSMIGWVFTWSATMVLADKAELYHWYPVQWMSMAAIIFNALIGLGMIYAFIRYLKVLDELQRKIQMDALAFTVGAGLVGGFTYSLLAAGNYIADAEASDVILVMMLAYMAANIIGKMRYR